MSTLNRLDARFAALKAAGKKAFIPFVTAGFPDLENFGKLLAALPAAGADVIEIGMPFSDPMADGPAIQAANICAFKAGISTAKILEFVKAFRKKDQATPIVLMGYYNPIYSYGVSRFLDDAKKAGIDALIVPDLPPEEDAELRQPADKRDLRVTRMATPTTDAARLPKILDGANGFIYYVSIAGITGSKSASADDLKENLSRIKAATQLPVCVGFGVSSPAQAKEMAETQADGVIVGSAIISRILQKMDGEGGGAQEAVKETLSFIADLAAAVHG